MKILYTPVMIVPSLEPGYRASILEAACPGTALAEAKDAAAQRREIPDADVLFGRVAPDVYVLHLRLRYCHSIGARLQPLLCPQLVERAVVLPDAKWTGGVE